MSTGLIQLVERHRGAETPVRPRHEPLFAMSSRGIPGDVPPLERESIPEMEPPPATDATGVRATSSAEEEFPLPPPPGIPGKAGAAPDSPAGMPQRGAPPEPQASVASGRVSEGRRTPERSPEGSVPPPDWPEQPGLEAPTPGRPPVSPVSEKSGTTPNPGIQPGIFSGQGALPGPEKQDSISPHSSHPPGGELPESAGSSGISAAGSPVAVPSAGEFEPTGEGRPSKVSPIRPPERFSPPGDSVSGIPDTAGRLSREPASPGVQISIGRIEVRLIAPPASPPPSRRAAAPAIPVSLEDYLKSRQGGS